MTEAEATARAITAMDASFGSRKDEVAAFLVAIATSTAPLSEHASKLE